MRSIWESRRLDQWCTKGKRNQTKLLFSFYYWCSLLVTKTICVVRVTPNKRNVTSEEAVVLYTCYCLRNKYMSYYVFIFSKFAWLSKNKNIAKIRTFLSLIYTNIAFKWFRPSILVWCIFHLNLFSHFDLMNKVYPFISLCSWQFRPYQNSSPLSNEESHNHTITVALSEL